MPEQLKTTLKAVAPIMFTFRGEEIRLRAGDCYTLPVKAARQLLYRLKGKVQSAGQPDWLELWREVAEVSDALAPDDPRLPVVLDLIERELDPAFAQDDRYAFCQGVVRLREVMTLKH